LPEIKKSFTEINKLILSGLQNSQTTGLADAIMIIKTNITENIQTI